MKCLDEGRLQAYLDGEVSRKERKEIAVHLEHCRQCQTLLKEMKTLDDWVRLRLEGSFALPSQPLTIQTDQAWERFNRHLQESEAKKPLPHTTQTHKKMKWGWKNMKQGTKRWISGIAAAGIIVGSFSIPQVQAAASEFLSIFRVKQVEFVKVTEDDLSQMANWLDERKAGTLDLKGLGKVWTNAGDAKQGQNQTYQTAEQAMKVGHAVPSLPKGYTVIEVNVQQPVTVNLKLNTDAVNKMLRQLQTGVSLDAKLNGKVFALDVPKQVQMQIKDERGAYIEFAEINPVNLRADKGVDLAELRKALLSLPFLPENIKKQLIDINDFDSTLPVPVFDRGGKIKEVKINGANGMVQSDQMGSSVFWEKDGKLRVLTNYQTNGDSQQLVRLAQQMN
ncbi:anti-sigma factor family protein [Laceyella sacchari]|uniref:Anti-sigma-W factor RsiW n=1 Tax=Laceyella sacchari TaxID=37482 RepID=A0ABY5U3P7_LACSH|nr:zf-HC2 domain-containing protein [Laceyella sacchari]UWE04271.1 zf-HC2 domain-containing protein [Laceyella sacchari]